jgi:hypothetical protein
MESMYSRRFIFALSGCCERREGGETKRSRKRDIRGWGQR